MSKFPEKLRNMNLLLEDGVKLGTATELTLPKLTYKTEEFRGAGMNAPIEIPMGMEKLEASFAISEYEKENFKSFGLLGPESQDKTKTSNLVFRGAFQTDSEVKKVEVIMSGFMREADFGTWKVGDNSELKCTMAVQYYKLVIGKDEVIEIDPVNMVEKVNGVDRMKSYKEALGA